MKKGLFSVVTAAKLWLKYLIAIIIRSPRLNFVAVTQVWARATHCTGCPPSGECASLSMPRGVLKNRKWKKSPELLLGDTLNL